MPSTYAKKSAERIQPLQNEKKGVGNEPWKEAEEKIQQIETNVKNVGDALEEIHACFEEQRQTHARAFGLLVRRIDGLEASQSEFFGNLQRKVEGMIEKATDKKFASLTEEENSLASKTIMAKVEESLREFRIAKSSLENRVDDCRSAFEGKLQQVEASVDSKVECLKQLLLSCEDETKSEIKDLNVALSGDEVSKGSCIERIESRLDQLETTFAKVAMDGDKAFNLDPEKAGKKRANTHRRYRIHLRPQQPQETGGTSEESNSLSTECFVENTDRIVTESKEGNKCAALELKDSFATVSSTLATMNEKFADVKTVLDCIGNTCTTHPTKGKRDDESEPVLSRRGKHKSKNRKSPTVIQSKEDHPASVESQSTRHTTPIIHESPRPIPNKTTPQHVSTSNGDSGTSRPTVAPDQESLKNNVDQSSRETDNRQSLASDEGAGECGGGGDNHGRNELPPQAPQKLEGGCRGPGRTNRRDTLKKLFSELRELENESSETSSFFEA